MAPGPNHSTASEAVPFRQAQGREQIGWGRALDVHSNVEVVHDASETRDANNLLQNLSRLLGTVDRHYIAGLNLFLAKGQQG